VSQQNIELCKENNMIINSMSSAHYEIVEKKVPTFYFIGVTTTKSSIIKVFPLWMSELGRPEVVLEGVDLKIHNDPESYRKVTAQIKFDPLSIGGLVTTHKIDLFNAAKDLFDFFDPYAQICEEISSISKWEGRLEGHAKDPISAGLTMDAIVGKGYFRRTGGDVLIFGAGGSALAILLHLANKQDEEDRPKKVFIVNRSEGRLVNARAMVEKLATDLQVYYIHNSDPMQNDALLASMPEHSIIINATGMGKDTPGSPITQFGLFPKYAIAWEFNYRGELDFMHQAMTQKRSRQVKVEDGWVYFVHGWTQVIAQVMHINLTQDLFNRLAMIAARVRQ
jgi:shikimate dehydrogenase